MQCFDEVMVADFSPGVQPHPEPSETAWCFAFHQGQLLVSVAPTLQLQPARMEAFEAQAPHYLGRLGALDCWALDVAAVPPEWQPTPLRVAMMELPAPLSAVTGRAAQVLEWARTHRFCGVCGTPTEAMASERARRCPRCDHRVYPRISPAMMGLVWRGRELLLGRSPGFRAGVFSALAGFVEAGESLEDCVRREVREEVGVQVTNLRYYGSQSWPFPGSLMVAFTAEWAAGEIDPQPGEIEQAEWFDIDALPPIPPRFSISGHLIRDTADWLRSRPA